MPEITVSLTIEEICALLPRLEGTVLHEPFAAALREHDMRAAYDAFDTYDFTTDTP